MFIFRWLKRLLILIGLATVIWWGVQYIKTNSPVRQKVEGFRQSGLWKEGVKDMRTWAGEIFKGVGQKLEEDVSDDERKKLDEILRREIEGTKANKGQEVKRPEGQKVTKSQGQK